MSTYDSRIAHLKEEHTAMKAILEERDDMILSQALRIKELREALEKVNAWAVCACITSAEDMAQNFPRILEITTLSTPDNTEAVEALVRDAERWSTVEALWFMSGEPLQLGVSDAGQDAFVCFDGAESAGATWTGSDIAGAIDKATATMKETKK